MEMKTWSYALFLFTLAISVQAKRSLSIEEEDLAAAAKAQVARAVENNLIRILAIATLQNEERTLLQPRQDDDDDVPDLPTPNPNVLPQVAQILGAIFSGSLNITRVVDGTFGLVPNIVRNQVQGLVKLLTGENVNLSGTSTVSPVKDTSSEPDAIFEEGPPSTVVPLSKFTDQVAQEPEVTTVHTHATIASIGKYQVKPKTKRTTTPDPPKPLLVDDEVLDRIERDLRNAADLEPYEPREPKFYAALFNRVFQDVNMTEVTKSVPSIFKGATQAIVLLDSLGLIDTLPGSEVLKQSDIDIDPDEE